MRSQVGTYLMIATALHWGQIHYICAGKAPLEAWLKRRDIARRSASAYGAHCS